ncbi:Histidine--tRNA ligase [bioreactor metagenome]|uniref:histidine--tRNA ligase n=1 Tax=bioreactor metagenome TaxID=1076179 RepID=A0A644UVX5_9ZZZZ|nr:histidine--tRNA ligase [Methanobrevibacter sp.]MEA4957901.1 histidine--tRNA ligase [Methanobrevibacter sp.]
MEFTRPRGTRDFLFDEMRERKKCENTLRKVFETYAYQEIKTPLFEDLKLFTTKSGDQIVDQLYNFTDKSNREITLRPEITAPVARLYINELQKTAKPIKLYYFGSCFRYERPQKGRFRQFWQFGCELIGAKSPEGEAEAIAMAEQSLENLGIDSAEIHINHLGIIRGLFSHFKISSDIQEEIMALIDKGDKDLLESELTNDRNPLIEINELSQILIKLVDFVGKDEVLNDLENLISKYDEAFESLNEFKKLINLLKSFKVSNYTLNLGIARGLDYYTGIVFEIYVPELGAQKQIAGGGSYNLVELFGGEKVESTGFAFGFDRLMNAIENNRSKTNNSESIIEEDSIIDVFVAPISNETREKSFEIGQKIRSLGIPTEIDLSRKKFKKLLNTANKLNAKYVILVGKDDLDKNSVTIKDMISGNQELVAIEDIKEFLSNN